MRTGAASDCAKELLALLPPSQLSISRRAQPSATCFSFLKTEIPSISAKMAINRSQSFRGQAQERTRRPMPGQVAKTACAACCSFDSHYWEEFRPADLMMSATDVRPF